jgi:Family of unknown function (DUF6152)
MKTRIVFLLFAASLLAVPHFVIAHHAEANFDHDNLYVMKGTVTKMDFVNPHIIIHFDVRTKEGQDENWVGTTSSPNAMRRYGWTPNSAKIGDEIVVTGFLDKEGKKIIQMAINVINGKNLEVSTTAATQLHEYKQRNPNKPAKNYN